MIKVGKSSSFQNFGKDSKFEDKDWYKSIPIYNNQQPRLLENFNKDTKFEDEEFKSVENSLISPETKEKILEECNKTIKDAQNKIKNLSRNNKIDKEEYEKIIEKEKYKIQQIENLLTFKEWKRISDLYKNYELFPSELDSDSFDQSFIEDCYFLSMVSLISKEPNLIRRLFQIPKNPYGYYEVILFIKGWKRVIIDDKIPGKITSNEKFIPLQSIPKKKCFYNFLIEKAWAKVNKMYYNIYGGRCIDSLEALTGFKGNITLLQNLDLSQQYYFLEKIYEIIKFEKQLFGVGNHSHAFSLLDIKKIHINDLDYHLDLELRNPWGNTFYENIFDDLIEQKKEKFVH